MRNVFATSAKDTRWGKVFILDFFQRRQYYLLINFPVKTSLSVLSFTTYNPSANPTILKLLLCSESLLHFVEAKKSIYGFKLKNESKKIILKVNLFIWFVLVKPKVKIFFNYTSFWMELLDANSIFI